MEKDTLRKIGKILDRIEVRSPFSTDREPIKIEKWEWKGNEKEFIVEYELNESGYVFHYSPHIAQAIGKEPEQIDVLEQFENEVLYVKRMLERGIGSKEYVPFTTEIY